MKCKCCGATEGVELEESRTCYDRQPSKRNQWQMILLDDPQNPPKPPDPNAPVPLCRDCAEEHHAYWNEMWSNYYSDLL
jgi:hypothetical protein